MFLSDVDGEKNLNLVRIFKENFELSAPIVEIGSYQVEGREGTINLRPFFEGEEYIGCDMRPGKGVDRVENIEGLTFADASVGSVISLNTLEHVQNCYKAADEIYRVLKPNGIALISSVMDFNIHDHPSDYWRFTPEGFHYLLRKFENVFIGYDGDPIKPRIVFGIGIKGAVTNRAALAVALQGAYQKANGGFKSHLMMALLPLRTLMRIILLRAPKIEVKHFKHE